MRAARQSKLAYQRNYEASWCELLGAVLDAITHKIGARRNRFVHDYWTVSNGTLERLDKRARIEKAGADLGKSLVFETWHRHLPDEAMHLTMLVNRAIIMIQVARNDVRAFEGDTRIDPLLFRLDQLAKGLISDANNLN